MVGANYTGGRRNAAKARSRDTTGRLQRGHFSKQRLGILTDALRSRRPDHQPPTRPATDDNPNLTSNPRSGSFVSPSRCFTSAPAATVYDISLRHARSDLAQKQLRLRKPAHPAVTSPVLTGKGEAFSPQTLPLATTSAAIPSCATTASTPNTLPQPSRRPEPAFPRRSFLQKQPAPVTRIPSKRQSKILDLIDISDREHILSSAGSLGACVRHHPTVLTVPCRLLYIVSHPIHPTNHIHCTRVPHSQSIPILDRRSRDHTSSMKLTDDAGIVSFSECIPTLCSPSWHPSCPL